MVTEELRMSLDQIRHEMPAAKRWIYMNTGTTGPLPERVMRAVEKQTAAEVDRGRIDPDLHQRVSELKETLRRAWAELTGATTASIALTQNTTEGIGLALAGLDWQAGDEVVTTNLEHSGVIMPLYLLASRKGVEIRFIDLGIGEKNMIAALEEAVTARTRMIVFSHVSYQTGAVLPMEHVASWARERGLWTLVDGAQGVGALPLNLKQTGVDFYAMPGQKWLCGPEGCGALYIAEDRLDQVRPTLVGWAGLKQMGPWPEVVLHQDARKFEVASFSAPLFAGMLESLRFGEEVGWPGIYRRTHRLAARFRSLLGEVPGVQVVTPDNHAGLVSFEVRGRKPEEVLEGLRARGILMRTIPRTPWVRASLGFFNSEEDVDRALEGVAEWP